MFGYAEIFNWMSFYELTRLFERIVDHKYWGILDNVKPSLIIWLGMLHKHGLSLNKTQPNCAGSIQ